jgi:hypothetical protein
MRWARYVARKGEKGSEYGVLVRKSEEKKILGKHRRRLEDNIQM